MNVKIGRIGAAVGVFSICVGKLDESILGIFVGRLSVGPKVVTNEGSVVGVRKIDDNDGVVEADIVEGWSEGVAVGVVETEAKEGSVV